MQDFSTIFKCDLTSQNILEPGCQHWLKSLPNLFSEPDKKNAHDLHTFPLPPTIRMLYRWCPPHSLRGTGKNVSSKISYFGIIYDCMILYIAFMAWCFRLKLNLSYCNFNPSSSFSILLHVYTIYIFIQLTAHFVLGLLALQCYLDSNVL